MLGLSIQNKDFSNENMKNESLSENQNKFNIGLKQQASALQTKPMFIYEPQLFPGHMIKKVTDGKEWHELSPNTKI